MPHAPAHRTSVPETRRPAARRPATVGFTLGQRVVQRRGVRGRRGVILIFTVVLLTLLAIMGTAYLATSRIDRQQAVARGVLPQQMAETPLLKDPSTLNRLHAGAERAVEGELVRDLFNVPHNLNLDSDLFGNLAFSQFRQTLGTPEVPAPWYENYDAPGRADAWLSSLLPRRFNSAIPQPVWPWISGPLGAPLGPQPNTQAYNNDANATAPFAESFFSDPRLFGTNGFTGGFGPTAFTGGYGPFNPNQLYPGETAADVTLNNDAVTVRNNVLIGALTLGRPTAGSPQGNVRTYPALQPAGATAPYLAGDADGDGIADGGLIPIVLNRDPTLTGANFYRRYLDTTNNVIYFASYRVIDNSAKLNLNTALDNRGDPIELAINSPSGYNENRDTGDHSATNYGPITNAGGATPPGPELREYLTDDPTNARTAPDVGAFGPNYGFFRSNVGLKGLLRELLTPMNQTLDSNEYNRTPAQSDLRQFIDARFPLLRKVPGLNYQQSPLVDDKDINRLATKWNDPFESRWFNGAAGAFDTSGGLFPQRYVYRSFGDLLETQFARRPLTPGGYLWVTEPNPSTPVGGVPLSYRTDALTPLDFSDAVALGARGGSLRNPLVPMGRDETALQFALSINTPNTMFSGDTPWTYFPASSHYLWFGWTQDFDVDPPTGAATDFPIRSIDTVIPASPPADVDTAVKIKGYWWASGTDPNKPPTAQDVLLQRSPRVLFTGYNGVTSVVPMRGDRIDAASGVTLPVPGLPVGMPAYTPADARDGLARHSPAAGYSDIGRDPVVTSNTASAVDLPGDVSFSYPNVKVSAATGTKEQLWRAFWSAMTVQVPFTHTNAGKVYYGSMWDAARPTGTGATGALPASTTWDNTYDPARFFNAFRSTDRYPSNAVTAAEPAAPATSLDFLSAGSSSPASYNERLRPTETLSTRQMALIRSAVAACNTIDLRDADNDITAMDVDITDDNNINRATGGTRYYARVYGTEKQLVISGVYVQTGATPFVAVEIYNPTDIPIQLSAYRLAMVERTGTNLTTGSLAIRPSTDPIRLSTDDTEFVQAGGYVVLESAVPGSIPYLSPPVTAHNDPTVTPDVYVKRTTATTLLTQIATANNTSELTLFRTRRADGVPFRDGTTGTNTVRDALENETAVSVNGTEDTAGPTLIETLVPLDTVDCRMTFASATANPDARFLYYRGRPAPRDQPAGTGVDPLSRANAAGTADQKGNDERPFAWRTFYSGRFYENRPAGNVVRATQTDTASAAFTAAGSDYAWREIGVPTAVAFGPSNPGDVAVAATFLPGARTDVSTMIAPAIPIQNFTPLDPYTETKSGTPTPLESNLFRYLLTANQSSYNALQVFGRAIYNTNTQSNTAANRVSRGVYHLLDRFPFGSPIAREMDLQAIPYIGTYKLFRSTSAATTWVESVPVTIDAWMVANDPTAVATANPDPIVNSPAQTATVGRFDPTITAYDNSWADKLTDFVSARQAPYQTYLPDVPSSEIDATFFNTKVPDATQDQRYAQDGPVTGTGAANGAVNARWTTFTERNGTTDATLPTTSAYRTGRRAGKADLAAGANAPLIQGLVNLNTAPQLVLRQLPWLVDYQTGQVDYPDTGGGGAANQVRRLTQTIDRRRETLATAAWTPGNTTYGQMFAFPSLLALNADETDTTIAPTVTAKIANEIGTMTDSAGATTRPVAQVSNPTTPPISPIPNDMSANAMMRGGMLNPVNRPESNANYLIKQLNANRVSNLTSTRSDVYTVYVTVQAWTWTGDNATQATQTRLVGERRSSFIVDRSQISQVKNKISDLIVLPIDKE